VGRDGDGAWDGLMGVLPVLPPLWDEETPRL
jgi:hypothetical protein